MNKFPWNCGECPLLQSYDLSVDDLTYVCLWSKAQIDDCDRYKSAECPLEKHDAKVRADVIDHIEKYMLTPICSSCNREACKGGMVESIQECETIRFLKGAIHDAIVEIKEIKT